MANPVSASDFGLYGLPSGAWTGLDAAVSAHLNAAWDQAMGILGSRGFPTEMATAGAGLTKAVCELAIPGVLGVRGVNPEEPGHQLEIQRAALALEWLKTVARGEFGLGPSALPARIASRTAGAFSLDVDPGADAGPRGW